MKRKITILVMIFVLAFTIILSSSLALDHQDDVLKLTIEDAVKLGIKNSIALKQVENEIKIKEVVDKRTKYRSNKLEDAEDSIDDGRQQISEAEKAINNGILPSSIQLPDGSTLSQGTNLNSLVKNGVIDETTKASITQQIKEGIDTKKGQLEGGLSTLDDVLESAGSELSQKLNMDDIGALDVEATGNLMTTMSEVSYEVTKASKDIYRNQIALLIQNSYYDVLKAQKMLEVKNKAMQRAEKQYNFAKDSYEVGIKAKDDMLLANVYYKGTEIEYKKAQGELKNALIELKKNLNIPLDTEIALIDVLSDQIDLPNLEEGLVSGLKNRLELKKASGEVIVYNLNFDTVKKKYPSNTFQYKEANLLKEKMQLNLQKTKLDVESSIRQSYETLKSTEQMLQTSMEMVEQAKESVEIAEYKYNEGFGIESSLLKKLDLESVSGTIVEVLAAQENLSQVEEKVIQITYGYNLAKMKYFNDIGKNVY